MAKAVSERKFKRASREQVSMVRDLKGIVEGVYQGFVEKEITDKTTNETKIVKSFNFDLDDGRLITVLGDAGLNSEILGAGIEPGVYIRISHKGKKDLGGGKSVNQYIVEVAD